MFETAPLAIASVATDVGSVVLQAPPTDLPAQVPEFVVNILTEIGSAAGEAADGLGETISGMTPGGSETAEGAAAAGNETGAEAAGAAAGNAPGR